MINRDQIIYDLKYHLRNNALLKIDFATEQ